MLKPNHWHVLSVLIFVVVVSAVGFGFDRLLVREGVPSAGVLLLSNVLTGVVAGALFLQNRLRAQEKQKLRTARTFRWKKVSRAIFVRSFRVDERK